MAKRRLTNQQIARILEEIGMFYAVEGVRFKPQAYAVAAQTVLGTPTELSVLYKKCGAKCVDDLPGVGAGITEHIAELLTTGRLKLHSQLKKKHPYEMFELNQIEGLGPKTAELLYKKFKVKNLRDLERVARVGRLKNIRGLGDKLGFWRTASGRWRLEDILPFARKIEARLRRTPGTTHVDLCGSIRRKKITVGDIDLIATTTSPEKLISVFKNLPEVAEVKEAGTAQASVRFKNGLDGDLLILKPQKYGSALLHFTGSKEHNIQIRSLAKEKGWSLSEHGLRSGNKIIASKTEEEIYNKLGLAWITPEKRLGRGEVEAAKRAWARASV